MSIYFWKSIFLRFRCMTFLPAYMYVCSPASYMSDADRGQKKSLDPVELELRMVVSHQMSAGNQSHVFCKNRCP